MQRPKIKVPKTSFDITIEITTCCLLAFSAIIIAYHYVQLPNKVPIYFNWPSKDANGMGAKNLLWVSPIISSIICLAVFKLNQYPWIFNYPTTLTQDNAKQHYKLSTRLLRWINLIVAISCLALTFATIATVLYPSLSINNFLFPALPVLFFLPLLLYLIQASKIK
ncbi:DUF1648 domain-containing protein [Mangrovimonas spongiae]|uniref:DUF1648 domain-containing protein n=1 Tax=Mangrovimonas spongiae TaxID=2494697 RepID=A0A3R9MG71_9FLAO|nr:DUF1648 domain-containing protein [Mangrovimonas spongiae]RSK41353.1 DUF1648 domain-containing protein [Mangrovimonas spongiae]